MLPINVNTLSSRTYEAELNLLENAECWKSIEEKQQMTEIVLCQKWGRQRYGH